MHACGHDAAADTFVVRIISRRPRGIPLDR
ncbi:hypothetical protein TRE132_39080 [Pseudomonas chlororaphis subsp. aurantiaca]|nr:hypothetical protein TRE132_39080 [Pseudomonas chlororaphis subsp. aurantiaca]